MNVGIIGAGISGIFLALMIKDSKIDANITLFDVNSKLGKKLLITGNGRANVGNRIINENSYNVKDAKNIVDDFPIEEQIKFYNSIGIEINNINELFYPFSFSSVALLSYINKYLKEKGIKFIGEFNVDDYVVKNKKIVIKSMNKEYLFDKIVIASGGLSSLSSNLKMTNMFDILKRHNYEISSLTPGLTPIIVNEEVKTIENLRMKVIAKLRINKKEVFNEKGEVIFKKDGLSGICIFNISSLIKRKYLKEKCEIILDLMPEIDIEPLINKLLKYNDLARFSCLNGIFDSRLSDYIRKRSGAKNLYKFTNSEIKKIAFTIKNLTFTYKDSYTFKESQVTIGGIEFDNLKENLESKFENNVYFIGEVLNADGLCGGYNIMFAMASAHRVYLDLI